MTYYQPHQNLSEDQWRNILTKVGFSGEGLDTALQVSKRESGWRPKAYNPKGMDNSYGMFQINMLGDMGKRRFADYSKRYGIKSYDDLYDPETNAKIAYQISKGGTNWNPWSTYTGGQKQTPGGGTLTGGSGGGRSTAFQSSVSTSRDMAALPNPPQTDAGGSTSTQSTLKNYATSPQIAKTY